MVDRCGGWIGHTHEHLHGIRALDLFAEVDLLKAILLIQGVTGLLYHLGGWAGGIAYVASRDHGQSDYLCRAGSHDKSRVELVDLGLVEQRSRSWVSEALVYEMVCL